MSTSGASGRAWQDGRRAWERLDGWDVERGGHPDDGDSAVEALSDIGLLRHLLDQAELSAVRTARRHRKSWAEIATKLGVTRQSAWERWRDLDDPEADRPATARRGQHEALQFAVDAVTEDAITERARRSRRRAVVTVPRVVGMTWEDARGALQAKDLMVAGPDGEVGPLGAMGGPGAAVTDQIPESGARVPRGSVVRLWVGRGGGSAGVREPRRPAPSPLSAREMRDEAVG